MSDTTLYPLNTLRVCFTDLEPDDRDALRRAYYWPDEGLSALIAAAVEPADRLLRLANDKWLLVGSEGILYFHPAASELCREQPLSLHESMAFLNCCVDVMNNLFFRNKGQSLPLPQLIPLLRCSVNVACHAADTAKEAGGDTLRMIRRKAWYLCSLAGDPRAECYQ